MMQIPLLPHAGTSATPRHGGVILSTGGDWAISARRTDGAKVLASAFAVQPIEDPALAPVTADDTSIRTSDHHGSILADAYEMWGLRALPGGGLTDYFRGPLA